jgi:hypothetical protein
MIVGWHSQYGCVAERQDAPSSVCDPDGIALFPQSRWQRKMAEFSDIRSENLILTRSGVLRNFRSQPVGGAVLALPVLL